MIGALAVCTALAAQQPAPRDSGATNNRYDSQVREYLRQHEMTLRAEGYQLAYEPFTGSLNEDDTESLMLFLEPRPGGYRIVGVCDVNCTDIDLALFNSADQKVQEDIHPDDTPLLVVSPSASRFSRYHLRVTMAGCSSKPCLYGVAVFRKK
jgi:hypothetical protein